MHKEVVKLCLLLLKYSLSNWLLFEFLSISSYLTKFSLHNYFPSFFPSFLPLFPHFLSLLPSLLASCLSFRVVLLNNMMWPVFCLCALSYPEEETVWEQCFSELTMLSVSLLCDFRYSSWTENRITRQLATKHHMAGLRGWMRKYTHKKGTCHSLSVFIPRDILMTEGRRNGILGVTETWKSIKNELKFNVNSQGKGWTWKVLACPRS